VAPPGKQAPHPRTEGRRPPRELKQERAIRTRGQVLNAAAAAFAERGFPSVTMLDIAELTGMTKGAVYFHYPNKEAVAVAVAEEFYAWLNQLMDDVRELPPLQAVVEYFTRAAVGFRDDKMVQAGARLQIEFSTVDTTLPVPFQDGIRAITELLCKAKAAGELPEDSDPERLAFILVSGFFGTQHVSWRLSGRADLAERVRALVAAVLPMAVKSPPRKDS
jgi:AcrR family transcriptional regulator